MRKALQLILALVLLLAVPIELEVDASQSEPAVVHVVLFYSNGCSYCNHVLSGTLPALQDKYQAKLDILLVDIATLDEVNNLYALGAAIGLSKEQVVVPFLVIDHTTLVGADQIDTQLSGLIDKYLASGGVDLPNIPELDGLLATGIAFNTFDPSSDQIAQAAPSNNTLGMNLAWGIMAVMAIAILLAGAFVARAFQGKALGALKGWLDFAIPILAILGLGVSIYLTYVEVSHAQAFCGPVGDCNTVQSSSYARLFGFFPIGVLGILGYSAILVTWMWRRLRPDSFARTAGPLLYGLALFGTLFSVYLTYLELFVIHAVCIWCLGSAIIITALMLLTLPPITQWLAITEDEE
jgi:uncharacterized membrane protein